jgi:hypothetical protein
MKEWLTEKADKPIKIYDEIQEASDWGWREMEKLAQPGDEIWHFSSGQHSFEMLCGREGYALVRDGEIVESICYLMRIDLLSDELNLSILHNAECPRIGGCIHNSLKASDLQGSIIGADMVLPNSAKLISISSPTTTTKSSMHISSDEESYHMISLAIA